MVIQEEEEDRDVDEEFDSRHFDAERNFTSPNSNDTLVEIKKPVVERKLVNETKHVDPGHLGEKKSSKLQSISAKYKPSRFVSHVY